jgi:hypothetical protein
MVLAYLYHQLCEACQSRGQNSGFRGYVYLLHVSSTTSFYFLIIYFGIVVTHVTCIDFVGLDDDVASSR